MGEAPRLGHAVSMTSAQPIIGASELARYELELDRLRGLRAGDFPDRMRRARGFVSADAAGGDARSVSARSPVGRALMGRRAGDVVSVDLPSGRVEALRIVAVTAPPAVEAA